jgi:hypothetical protein
MPPSPVLNMKVLYQAALAASLVFLFVALFVVHPYSRFGVALTLLAIVASIGSGIALKTEKDRASNAKDSPPP